MSQSKNGYRQARAYFYSILAMLGLLGLVGGGTVALIRFAARADGPA